VSIQGVLEQRQGASHCFTPLHGTGAVTLEPIAAATWIQFRNRSGAGKIRSAVGTVRSPNPEKRRSLTLESSCEENERDVVIATDPRFRPARRGRARRDGRNEIISGNQIGSLLAYYRLKKFFDLGSLNKENASHAVVIKLSSRPICRK